MKQVKIAVAALGAVGLVAIFLPYVSAGGESASFWKLAKMGDVAIQAYMALVGFGLAAAMGIIGLTKGGMTRVHGIVATVGFGLAIVPEGVRKGMDFNGIGGKLLLICAAVGLVAGIVAIAKPEKN